MTWTKIDGDYVSGRYRIAKGTAAGRLSQVGWMIFVGESSRCSRVAYTLREAKLWCESHSEKQARKVEAMTEKQIVSIQ